MASHPIKSSFIVSTIFLSAFFVNLPTYATPTNLVNINIECPRSEADGGTTGVGFLRNDGLIISGFGIEFINGKSFPHPIFTEEAPADVPTRLEVGGYYRVDTDYDSERGNVTCFYKSTAGKPDFHVHYQIANGRGGAIKYKTAKSIYITYLVGIKA